MNILRNITEEDKEKESRIEELKEKLLNSAEAKELHELGMNVWVFYQTKGNLNLFAPGA